MSEEQEQLKACGIVMPISSIDGCSDSHWVEVLGILNDAIEDAGFEGNLVSNADEVGIIHKRIIQNLYDNPIVVCDVSCKNPNVMFELGLRLAFDKPTIIVKDDQTSYSFDTSAIEHLEYPRDLRFSRIVEFKEKLTEKIKATYKKSTSDPEYTTFLKHFGEFKVAKIEKREVSGQEFILEELRNLRRSILGLEKSGVSRKYARVNSNSDINICMGHGEPPDLNDKMKILLTHPALMNVSFSELDHEHYHLIADVKSGFAVDTVSEEVEKVLGRKKTVRRRRNVEGVNNS